MTRIKEKSEKDKRWFTYVKTHRWTENASSVHPLSVASVKSVVPDCIRLEAGMAFSVCLISPRFAVLRDD